MLMSCPLSSLVAGVKIGSGSRSLSVKPGGRRMPQTAAALLIFLPAGARQIAADDALDRHDLGLAAPACCGRPAARGSTSGGQVRSARRRSRACGCGSPSWSNQKALICVSTRPLSGIPVGRTQSKALIRSVLTSSSSLAEVVDVADLAAADELEIHESFVLA